MTQSAPQHHERQEPLALSTIERGAAAPVNALNPCPVSVIIVSYWTGPLLMRSVMSAIRQPLVCEVIVVDNGNWSDQMTRLADTAGDYSDKLKIITGHGNIGYAAGCNRGVAASSGDYIFILNPDAILTDNAVEELLTAGKRQQGDWVIGGKLVNPDGTEQAGSRRGPLTPWTALIEITQLYRFAPNHPYFRRFNNHQDPCPEEVTSVPCISGACMLMPRQTYDLVGGMDEDYFLHVEDVDFCLRMNKAGGAVYFAPKTPILHFKSSSRASRLRIEMRKAHSMVRYFWSHFKDPYPFLFLVLVSVLVWVAFAFRASSILVKRALALVGIRLNNGRKGLHKAYKVTQERSER
ncbi:MAG: glycosyltransferase family 2 protein [bacterium]